MPIVLIRPLRELEREHLLPIVLVRPDVLNRCHIVLLLLLLIIINIIPAPLLLLHSSYSYQPPPPPPPPPSTGAAGSWAIIVGVVLVIAITVAVIAFRSCTDKGTATVQVRTTESNVIYFALGFVRA